MSFVIFILLTPFKLIYTHRSAQLPSGGHKHKGCHRFKQGVNNIRATTSAETTYKF